MFNPVSTYRIQFHKGFTFKDFKETIPYLQQLGVSSIYASPIFEATPGSNHGYDIINPHRINPEIGTLDELRAISKQLKALQINWVQDIVPNHMAFHPHNAWLMDVFEHGVRSAYANFFDMWDNEGAGNRLMVPFLGSPLPQVIEKGQLSVMLKNRKLSFSYGEQIYPLNKQSVKRLLNEIGASDINAEVQIDDKLKSVNQNKGLLQQLADEQYYELCNWQDTDSRINYRRFFTVNGLICLNMQDSAVFDEYHRFINQLLSEGLFQGLRIDHVDGLYDPKTYLKNLRALVGAETYIVVEKILENGEDLPLHWPIQGTTGYDFLGTVNNLFTNPASKGKFNNFYHELTGPATPVGKAIPQKKADILYQHMGGELDNLCRLFNNLNIPQKLNGAEIKEAIAEFLIRCPVYRFYGNQLPLSPSEASAIKEILRSISRDKPVLKKAVSVLIKLFTLPQADDLQAGMLHFYQRCMQLSGPLMAKGVEDTLMYTYDRFIGHNEVGDSPDQFGLKITAFHNLMQRRAQKWPMALSGTSTHDTKRGEDARARLNVLTDVPEDWFALVKKWAGRYNKFKTGGMPDANDEYLIYQTLAAITALPAQPEDDIDERLRAYLTKALREAKVHTQWAAPNEAYENATIKFTKSLLTQKPFKDELAAWQQKIADYFVINALSQVMLKFTCPGIPDVYQGCELWDFSLVDPDNRRPVDYGKRARVLNELHDLDQQALWQRRYDGSLKLWFTNKLLQARKAHAALFTSGNYIPLQVKGKYKSNVMAFARRHNRKWLLTVVPLHLAQTGITDVTAIDWEDTAVLLPAGIPLKWSSLLTGEKSIFNDAITLKSFFTTLPIGVWVADSAPAKRNAGIIMHITSLPSAYGVGDIGPAARQFAGFLSDAYQHYWQLLPVNPTSAAAGFSPYSAYSAMAGNHLLISPEDLVNNGLLTVDEAVGAQIPSASKVDYNEALQIKTRLLEKAFARFETESNELTHEFEQFKEAEKHWLDDFALYAVAKEVQQAKPWYDWPAALKNRDPQALADLRNRYKHDVEKARWLQFIFDRQWQALKSFCHERGVYLLGDLSFYISYDSVDVWANPALFELDEKKSIKAVAGVPPDYFNADGQLWGMPVYRWEEHTNTGYSWWMNRVKRNLTFFDKIRLDHFRAFNDFWSVPARDKTAAGGKWLPGPGIAIFDALKKALGTLPFIAEDLGDISEGVYELRDKLQLPGMNVLQFAFGTDMPVSVHIPHNHLPNSVTYTGTHDNNTLLGWLKEDSTPEQRSQLSAYLRTKVKAANVNRLMGELCYSSASSTAILPMQDLLGLGSDTRMNVPSSPKGNWAWKMKGAPGEKICEELRRMVLKFNR